MSTPFVSFLCSAYRTEQYVPGLITSLLAQTDPDWELVIVDNGQSDEMAAVISTFTHDPRVRMVRQENRGVIGGFARASDEARGVYVSPLASDDEVVPHYVERMRDVLHQHPEAIGVGCDSYLFSDEHPDSYQRGLAQSMEGKEVGPSGGWLSKLDLLDGRMPYYGGVFNREAWNAIGGMSTEDDTVDEIIRLYVMLLEIGPVFVIQDRLGRYRLRDDSHSRNDATVEAFGQRVLNSYHVFSAGATPEEQAAAQRMIRRLGYLHAIRRARRAFVNGDTRTARAQARIAWENQRTARAFAILVLLYIAPPRLLASVHPWKRRFADWMLIHSPVDWIRMHINNGSHRAISGSEPGAATPDTAPVEEQRGLPPTSP